LVVQLKEDGVYPYVTRLRVIPVTLALAVMGLLVALGQVKDSVRAGPGGMRLLPGYLHEREMGIDTCPGKIWKPAGPEIGYDIGFFAADAAHVLATQPGVAWSKTQDTGRSTIAVTMTRGRYLGITVTSKAHSDKAGFVIQNATDEALADALLMIMTYDPDKGCRF